MSKSFMLSCCLTPVAVLNADLNKVLEEYQEKNENTNFPGEFLLRVTVKAVRADQK